jgi:hypothetical protein
MHKYLKIFILNLSTSKHTYIHTNKHKYTILCIAKAILELKSAVGGLHAFTLNKATHNAQISFFNVE